MGDKLRFPIPLQIAVGAAGTLSTGFSATQQLAQLCDQLQPDLGLAEKVVAGAKVVDLIQALPPPVRERLETRFGQAAWRELLSLEKECDSELFYSGLLHLAGRLAQEESTVTTAIGLYYRVEISAGTGNIVSLANQRRQVLEGGGNVGQQAESTLRHLGQQLGDYRTLIGMFAGAMVGSGLYNIGRQRVGGYLGAALRERLNSPNFSPIEIVAMRFKSRAAGLALGSVGSALTERGLRAAMGQNIAWNAGSIARDTAMASLNLFAWRSAVALSDMYAMRAMATVTPTNGLMKELEVFGFQKALGATSLGLAAVANQKIFDRERDTRGAMLSQLGGTLLGMSFGRMLGRRAVLLSR